MEVKTKLLNDDDLVVSAPPGCGKTTLATQLCHDEEIKGMECYLFAFLNFYYFCMFLTSGFQLIFRKVRVYLLLRRFKWFYL